ncbi:hypothetical protein AI2795V1_1037 [Serratia marcescens]|uniref:hypothetical protein n=1 Tax=Serratia marcescens TaxID=615 RepID=UPI001DBFEA20|nr:hypothetical protein [Serratia marcescens]CAE7748901.1 hypothetical protein AI2795V1_1037 [Serratia marcescens]CAH3555843.1 hypothetical protein AI2795V1_1037 [Serratia marcescens]
MTRTLTTEQLRALRDALKSWQDGYDPVDDKEQYKMFVTAETAVGELLANREAQPVGKAEITKIAAELVRGDYLSKLWTEAEKSRHVDTHRLQNLLDELHDAMKVKAIAITRLLTTPPAPAVPEEMPLARAIEIAWKDSDIDSPGSAYRDGWNACRAAMLKGERP